MHVLNKGLWHYRDWLTVALGMAWSIPTLLTAWAGSPWPGSNHSTLCHRKTNCKRTALPTDGANWCCTESVGWTLRLRWTTNGCGMPTKWTGNQKGGRSGPTKHLPMAKSISQGWSSNLFLGVKCPRNVLTFVSFKPVLYIEIFGVVISSVTSPRFTEANEFGHNFLKGYRSCNR